MAQGDAPVPSEISDEVSDPINSTNMSTDVLSMYVPIGDDEEECEYRIRFGNQIKYITVDGGAIEQDKRSFPPDLLAALPKLPRGDWVTARIFKAANKDTLSYELSHRMLNGVNTLWHPTRIDILSLTRTICHSSWVYTVTLPPNFGAQTAILKFARFEFEVYGIEKETALYEIIQSRCPGVGPAFLGHVTEQGRAMGFLIEFLEGRWAGIEDLAKCQEAVKKLHSQGILHGDLNRYNFIVSDEGQVRLIDFADAKLNASEEDMQKEYDSLPERLVEESGLGKPITHPV
ncbi:hypothetical protein CVT26_009750 [Gymnopilus dilepis]|uniref:non-specific serine/threonine protein kinase n=1 Tax=Gymnopilus dilepis TaxID=231916 RepID=A0A409YIU0_9AGAR|nr:hypothetical protein CVT26_009750 [Gymnopilus dilepis]